MIMLPVMLLSENFGLVEISAMGRLLPWFSISFN